MRHIIRLMSILMFCSTAAAAEEGPCQEKDPKQKVACLNVHVHRFKNATEWNVGCTLGVCVAVDRKGALLFFDGSDKKLTGKGQLPGSVDGPVSISCSSTPAQEGCVAVDAKGRFWIGSPRGNDYQFITQAGP